MYLKIDDNSIKEFSEATKKAVEYHEKNLNMNQAIIITYDGAKIVDDSLFVPSKDIKSQGNING
jgi:hypothetical protein